MKCNEIEDRLIDYLDGNLSPEEQALISSHLSECSKCTMLLEQNRKLLDMMHKVPRETPPATLRVSFEQMLRDNAGSPTASKPGRYLSVSWKTAIQVAASLLLLLTGYFMGVSHADRETDRRISQLEEQSQALKTEITLAMLNNRSASKRIQAVSYSEEMEQPDAKVLQAVINRLHYDENVNVRLAAAEALWKFRNEELVTAALIQTLETEKNPDIQIAVIGFLVEAQDKRAIEPMQKLLNEPDIPSYVKEQLNDGLTKIL